MYEAALFSSGKLLKLYDTETIEDGLIRSEIVLWCREQEHGDLI